MLEDMLTTFTDRREAIALFELLRKRELHQSSWPLSPILSFIAPGGGGKSTLIEYLITGRCEKDGRAILPYAHIDFTKALALRDLLSILIELRDQLTTHADEHGQRLTFPRFDLGAAIAMNASFGNQLPHLGDDEIRQQLTSARTAFHSLHEMGNALGNIYLLIPPLLVGLQWSAQLARKIKPLNELLLQLEHTSEWAWYLTHSADIGLSTKATLAEVLLRLHALSVSSRPGKEGREYLINQVLPAALSTDLYDALDGSTNPRTWNASTNIVLFLDGFEALLESSSSVAHHLLKVLACSAHRQHGETDPLLLIIGSRYRLFDNITTEQREAQHPSLHQHTQIHDDTLAKEDAHERYIHWFTRLPTDTRHLRVDDLYLPLWLHDFGSEDTSAYLSRIDEQEHTVVFTQQPLVQAIYHATHGHPLYLALAAAALLEAQAHHRTLTADAFEHAPVPQLWNLAPGHDDEQVGEYLLSLFLQQLPQTEQKQLIFCAAPRFLNSALLGTILHLPTDEEARERFRRYRRFTFVSALDEQHIVFHPVVRMLLLRQMPPSHEPKSDYVRTHTQLQEYFQHQALTPTSSQQPEAVHWLYSLEEAYHALALGHPESAIWLGSVAQQGILAAWKPLVEAVTQAPTHGMPPDIEKQAYNALMQAERHHNLKDSVTAIILYTWLVSASQRVPYEVASHQNNLGAAYSTLPAGDRAANLARAIDCYQAALEIFHLTRMDYYIPIVSENLEAVRNELQDLEEP